MSKSNIRASKKILKGGDDISNQHLKNLEHEIEATNETFLLADLETQVVSILKKINSKIVADLVPTRPRLSRQIAESEQPTNPTQLNDEDRVADMVGGKKSTKKTSKKSSKKTSKKSSKKTSKKSSKKTSKKLSRTTMKKGSKKSKKM